MNDYKITDILMRDTLQQMVSATDQTYFAGRGDSPPGQRLSKSKI